MRVSGVGAAGAGYAVRVQRAVALGRCDVRSDGGGVVESSTWSLRKTLSCT